MSPDDLKQALRTLGLTQEAFGELLFSARRTVTYWTAEAVPGPVEAIARLLLARPELVEVMREIREHSHERKVG